MASSKASSSASAIVLVVGCVLWLFDSGAIAQSNSDLVQGKTDGRSVVLKQNLLALQQQIKEVREETGSPAIWAATYRSENHRPVLEIEGIQHTGLRKYGSDVPVADDDLVHLGSCTKAMTATLIAQAITAGKLQWTSSLDEIFGAGEMEAKKGSESEDQLKLGEWGAVTVRELITHRSGAPNYAPWHELHQENLDDVVAARHELLKWMCQQNRPQKRRHVYSNTGYAILGHILEHIEKQPWETIIQRKLFKPLEMRSAGFGPVKAEHPLSAPWGHRKQQSAAGIISEGLGALFGRKKAPAWEAIRIDNPPPLGPAGTCHMKIRDWAKFVALFGDLEPDPRLQIDAPNWKQLFDASDQKSGQPYAGGWVPFGQPDKEDFKLFHNGSNTTWYCVAMVRPHDHRFALVVANSFSTQVITTCDSLADELSSNAENSP